MPTVQMKSQYEEVRAAFFPTWDRKRRWSIHVVADLDGAQGRCNPERRRIELAVCPTGDELWALIIHEIVHAVAGVCHGRRWQARMEKAASDAEGMGQANLAAVLRTQVADYQDTDKVSAKVVYREIEDAVRDVPTASFLAVVDMVRRDYGLPRDAFLKRFRRSEAIFAEAQGELEEKARHRAAMAESATPSELPASTTVCSRDGKIRGKFTGGCRPCSLEDCPGERLAVRWDNGKLTWPCIEDMEELPDGSWKLIDWNA